MRGMHSGGTFVLGLGVVGAAVMIVLAAASAPAATSPRAIAAATDGLAIAPAAFTLLTGETQELTVEGSPALPLTWGTTDQAILSVSEEGVVTAVAPGHARITVRDADGATAISEICAVAHLDLTPATVSVRNSQAPFLVAVRGDLGPWQVQAFELTLSFDPDQIEAVGASAEGTLCEGWGEPTAALAMDHVRVAHAGATAVSGSGALVGILLRLRPGATAGASIDVSLGEVRLNEGLPIARGRSGAVHVIGTPVVVRSVTVDPPAAQLRPNTLLRFTATVAGTGVGGVAWSVLGGDAHGVIDADGLYRAPAVPPESAYAAVVATSLEDASVSGLANVDLLPAEAAGLISLVALKNPANPRALELLVSAAGAFLAAPAVTVDGQAVAVTAVDGSATVYRGHVSLPQTAAGATFHAQGSTAQGSGEADLVVAY